MKLIDDIARRNFKSYSKAIADGEPYTKPWLSLNVEALKAYRDGHTDALPEPWCHDPRDGLFMAKVRGLKVLLLAGGGGQQSAVFSLLGAEVTVLDLLPEQLELDQRVAAHYGYNVTTIQGDMRDLSELNENCFDRVYQPISSLYIPDVSEVFAEVARVLKHGGLYSCEFTFPHLYLAEDLGWDGEGYVMRVRAPYLHGAICEDDKARMSFTKGELTGEFHHRLSDIVNGLVARGFFIEGVWESPRPVDSPAEDELQPGSRKHHDRFIPFGLSTLGRLI